MSEPVPEIVRPSWGFKELVWAGFTTRKGGYSTGLYAELNFSWKWKEPGVGADENHVLLSRLEGYDLERLYFAKQVHGADGLATEDTVPSKSIKTPGDFVVSSTEGDVCAVITADCVPLLMLDPEVPCVAAVHSGWRGTLAKVGAAALKEMKTRYGADPARVLTAIGPAIRRCCFEVGAEVEDAFREVFPEIEALSLPGPRGRPHIDLLKAIYATLDDAGVSSSNVQVLGPCTFCDSDHYYSYRRDGSPMGQHMAYIGLRPRV